jgi:hypothetical protein
MSRQETPFFLILLLIIAIIAAGVLFTLYQQAKNESSVAVTSQFVAETRRETAAFSAQIASTGQAFAEIGQATAIAVARLALTGQAEVVEDQGTAVARAETQQARAISEESTAVANANLAGTAQALAEETAEAALEDMYDAATRQALAIENEATAVANAEAAATNQAVAVASADALTAEQAALLETIAALENNLATLQADATQVASQPTAVVATPTPANLPTEAAPTAGATAVPRYVRYVTSSGNLGFEHLDTWIVEEQDGDFVVVFNAESAAGSGPMAEGEFFMIMFPLAAPESFDLARAATVYAESVTENITQGRPLDFDDAELLTVGDYDAGRVHGLSNDYEVVVYMLAVPGEGSVIVMMGLTTANGMAEFEPEMVKIGASVTYIAPAPTPTRSS